MAMYLAKDRGKSRYEVFEEGMHATVFERLELKADLARGIEDGQLRLLYQPIVSLQTGRITGVEALVRWDHPRRGMLSPQAFVGLAEDTGLILPLGQWVLEEACQQLRAWQLTLPSTSSLTMSVNLSVRQLQHEHIVRDVISTIDRFGLDASTITLEITETTLMHDTEVTRRTLSDLRDAGVSLAVDDFGTGYSSLQYVQRFPIDSIKIDRSFVSGLGEEAGDTAVVQSMIELAQRLGVHTVAEGIERPEQITLLQALGADLGQGYLFSRPVRPDQIGELLHRSISEGTRFLIR
jgi:EAL domain-containing protein (putative c-di-GMP-specific phosphodiesterase class I)